MIAFILLYYEFYMILAAIQSVEIKLESHWLRVGAQKPVGKLYLTASDLHKEWHNVNDARRNCSSILAPGSRIITNDLRDPKRNHVQGVLITYDGDAGRWQVQLDGEKEPLKIRPRNLIRLSG